MTEERTFLLTGVTGFLGKVLLEELLPRLAGIEQTGPAARLRSNFINGVKHLPVRVKLA